MSGGRNSMLDVSSSTAPHLQCWMCRWVSRWTWNSSARPDGVIAPQISLSPIPGATVLGSGGCWGLSPGPWAGRASALPAEPAPRPNRDGKAHTSDLPSVIKIFFFFISKVTGGGTCLSFLYYLQCIPPGSHIIVCDYRTGVSFWRTALWMLGDFSSVNNEINTWHSNFLLGLIFHLLSEGNWRRLCDMKPRVYVRTKYPTPVTPSPKFPPPINFMTLSYKKLN